MDYYLPVSKWKDKGLLVYYTVVTSKVFLPLAVLAILGGVFGFAVALPSRSISAYDLQKFPTVAKFERMFPGTLNYEGLIESANVPEYERARQEFVAKTFGMYNADKGRAIKAGFCLDEEKAPPRQLEIVRSDFEEIDGRMKMAIRANKELGFDLEIYVPWAYYLHLYGCDYYTQSFKGLDPFFWFSKNHSSNIAAVGHELWYWRLSEHSPWAPTVTKTTRISPAQNDVHPPDGIIWPPYKSFFQGSSVSSEQSKRKLFWRPYHQRIFPTMVRPALEATGHLRTESKLDLEGPEWRKLKLAFLTGKHTHEFSQDPVNTYAWPETLGPLLDLLLDAGYIVMYNRPIDNFKQNDPYQQTVKDVGDYDLIRDQYKDRPVFNMPQFIEFAVSEAQKRKHVPKPDLSIDEKEISPQELAIRDTVMTAKNIVQMSLYAQGDYFVSTQGGSAALASLFAEKQFIYHRFGPERLYPVDGFPKVDNFVYKKWWQHHGAWVYADGNFANLLRHIWADLVESTGLDIARPPEKDFEANATKLSWGRWPGWFNPDAKKG